MVETKKYIIFREDNNLIMFDKLSGAFSEIPNEMVVDNNYDLIYENNFSSCKKLADTMACEGPRLGRLSFLTTQYCNLKCRYCFANSGTYNSTQKDAMSSQTMKKAFEYLCHKYRDGINLVHFFGGEPMLGYKSIEEFVPWCYEYCEKKKLVPPIFSIVSNGTVMNKEIYEFFNKYRVNIVVSIDGNRELNDRTRISDSIPSVYEVIKKNFSNLPKERNFKIGCEMTLNKNHITAYKKGIVKEWLDDICQIGFNYATVGVAETAENDCKITIEEKSILENIEREVIDYFFERFMEEDDFRSVEIVNMIRQLASHKRALSCGAGYHSLTVNHNGNILPCYQFYHDNQFDMGTIENKDEEKFNQVKEILKNGDLLKAKECEDCWLNGYCTVQCKGFSYNTYGELNHVADSRCWMLGAATRRILMQIIKLHKDPERYNLFVKRLYAFNKSYTYN